MPRRLLVLAALLAPLAALAQPPAPPDAERAAPGRAGWSVAPGTGCWLWNQVPREGEQLTFSGDCPQGPAEGPGEGEWRWVEDGRPVVQRFGGVLRNGRLHGPGYYAFGEEDRYDGAFREGLFHGHGVHVWPDDRRYSGEWRDDVPHGPGVYADADGTVTGTWRSGCLFDGDSLVMAIGRTDEECAEVARSAR
jgi:hypothetical protein